MPHYGKGQFVKIRGDEIFSRYADRIGLVIEVKSSDHAAVRTEKYVVSFADEHQEEFCDVQLEFPSFTTGDVIRVSPALASDHAGMVGQVVALEKVHGCTNHNYIDEYEVEFNDNSRRRFLAFQLTPAAPVDRRAMPDG